jgi:hypothetical protein
MTRRRAGVRRLPAVGLLAVGVALTPLALSPPAASAEAACSTFAVTAAADGTRVEYYSPGFQLFDQADTEGPAAQATANSLNKSQAYAGAPYPGDAGTSAVALGGQDPSVIPTYVSSQYPTQKSAERSQGGVVLKANSNETDSQALATAAPGTGDGTAGAGLTTTKAVAGCSAAGRIAADATTDTEAASFAAGTLRLGRINAEAHAFVDASGKTVVKSALDVGQVTVAGQTVEFSEAGLVFPGGAQALPDNPLADALAGAGLEVTYVGAVVDKDRHGVTAPGLRVVTTQELGGAQPTRVTYTFGRGYARAAGEPGSAADGTEPTTTDTTVPAEPQPGGGGDAPRAGGEHIQPGSTEPNAATESPDIAPTNNDGGTKSAGTGGGTNLAAGSDNSLRFPLEAIYLALVVGATAVFGGGSLIRLIGVRLAWI